MLPFAELDAVSQSLRHVFALAIPEAFLLVAACLIYLGGTVRASRSLWASAALTSLLLAFWLFWKQEPPADFAVSVSALTPDRLSGLVHILAYAGGVLLLFLFWNDVPDERSADFFACLLILVAGLSLVGGANDLLTMFLALELISIPTYVLLYLPRSGERPQEAAIKYFLLSIFSSAVLLFGFSYVYGVTGSVHLSAVSQRLSAMGSGSELLRMATVMIVAGLAFRITAVPFHFYAPDVFQGVSNSLAAMLSVAPKLAGFAALVRLGPSLFWAATDVGGLSQTTLLFLVLAALTMTVGNVLGLLQTDLRRLLAYSSIAHGGYMLVGLAAATQLRGDGLRGVDAVFFYLVAYAAMTLGAFAVLNALRAGHCDVQTIDDLAGVGRNQPLLALALMLFLFSLIGLPLTAGFAGKLLLFLSALSAEEQLAEGSQGVFALLALIGALNAAAGAYYYLRLVGIMYLRESVKPQASASGWPVRLTVAICVVLTLALGIYPTRVVSAIHRAVVPESALVAWRAP
jgi:NADH-quinone oxidoreductase subunit N